MGEAEDWKKEFTPEELTALGEAPQEPDNSMPTESKPDEKSAIAAPEKPEDGKGTPDPTPKTEQKEEDAPTPDETKAAEAMGLRIENGMIVDEDGTKIPPKRWKKLYFEHQERGRKLDLTTKKLDLFKQMGADRYYQLYPQEAPEGYKPQPPSAPVQPQVLPIDDPRILALKVTGGTYDGMTLEDVFDVDKPAAVKMYGQYVAHVNDQTTKAKERESKAQQEIHDAVVQFGRNRAKELFGVEDPSKLTAEQVTEINRVGQDVLNWQVMNSKLHLDWEDAFKLMTYDQRLNKAKEEAAASALKGLAKTPSIPSIGNGGGTAKDTGYESMLSWTSDQMGKYIDGLSDKDFLKFQKDAPASLKAKFPGVFE